MIRLELPYDIRLVPGTAYWLSDIAEKYGVSARRAASLCFVVETALENRVQNATEEAAFFTVTLEEHSDTVSVSITDKGVPYVLSEKQKEILQAGLVSSFSFEQLAIQGQRVRFDVTKEPQSDPEPPMTEAKEETLLDKEIRCRTTGTDDEDILRAIRIIYSAYGFRYFHQDIYHHDYFRAALLSGKFVSVLAENAHGQTLGHAALDEHDWFPGIPEVCILVVKEFARGVRASEQLVNATVEAGLSRNFEGVHAIPVLQHPISQKLFNKQGFTPSGFYFHMCLLYSGISREDAAICVTILNRDRLHSLYLPSECEDFVRRVFETAGAAYEVLPEGESPRSELESCYRLDTINRSLEIRIDNVGQDFAGSLAALELPKDINTTEVVMVYLNMNDPGCPSAYRYFRERGFIFTGCLPGGTAGDYLLLEHLKGFPIIQELMVLEPNYQEMLDQIMEMAEDDREQ